MGKCVVAERYEDPLTGQVFAESDLAAQYREYVRELGGECPEVQPCSFSHWLRGELEDRLQVVGAVGDAGGAV